MKGMWWLINGALAMGLFAVSLSFARYNAADMVIPYGIGAGSAAFAISYIIVALFDKPNPDKKRRRRKRVTYGLILATIITLLLTIGKQSLG